MNSHLAFLRDWHTQQAATPRSEVALFRLFSKLLSQHFTEAYYYEVHGNKAQVEFPSKIWPSASPVRKEIGDLIIIAYSNHRQEARYTVMQNKFERSSGSLPTFPNFVFGADIYQWDLLTFRPEVNSVRGITLPKEILSGTGYSSVGSYGVFYQDTGHLIDFAYSIAGWLTPTKLTKQCRLILNCVHPIKLVGTGEIAFTFGIQNFAQSLLDFEIGAPIIDSPTGHFLGGLISKACRENEQDLPNLDIPGLVLEENPDMGDGEFRLLLVAVDQIVEPRESR